MSQESEEKNKFLLFLDFDGVLNDLKTVPHILKLGGLFVRKNDDQAFHKGSIDALNYFIDTISKKYEVQLVLSTFWKNFFDKAVNILKINGINYEGKIDRTPVILGQNRAKEIIYYLENNQDWEDFLVIDDKSSIKRFFTERNFINTNIWNGALKMSDILNYLDSYFPELAKLNPIKDDVNFESNDDNILE